MFCRNCGTAMNPNQAVCVRCGVQAGVGNSYCSYCGQPVNPNADVCMSCGVSLRRPVTGGNVSNLNGQDKVTMALVCFFLGGIGIHNFMMGEQKKGIFKIIMAFFCGLSGIFALIDFIKILTNSYTYDPNALI